MLLFPDSILVNVLTVPVVAIVPNDEIVNGPEDTGVVVVDKY